MAKAKKHILVVDDEPAWLQILAYILNKKGYEVRGESSAAAALEALKTFKPDMIVSDVRMPDMNGFDFLDHVKHSRKVSKTPFVFISAIDDEESRNAARNLGATDYLTKPFNEDDVVRILTKHLNES
ncbi:MAG TPA: response regulator [Bacteroidota bacterium]|nr:response regulator [Bacteroidota bacterium]